MGFNTAVMFCNDAMGQMERHPEEFVQGILHNYHRGGDFGVGYYGNGFQVLPSEHADYVQIIAVGGNYATKLHTAYGVSSHHTEEGKIKLLKQWADELGYRVVKKPNK